MSSFPGGQYPHQAEFYRAAVELLVSRWGESQVRIMIIIIMIVISHHQVIIISDDMEWCRQEIR